MRDIFGKWKLLLNQHPCSKAKRWLLSQSRTLKWQRASWGPLWIWDLCHPAKWKFWEVCYLFVHKYDWSGGGRKSPELGFVWGPPGDVKWQRGYWHGSQMLWEYCASLRYETPLASHAAFGFNRVGTNGALAESKEPASHFPCTPAPA